MKRIISIILSAAVTVGVLCGLSSCGRSEKYADALRIGTLSLPKNLNPFSATSSSATFFVEQFYDTLLGSAGVPDGYARDPEHFTFEDGTAYTPIDTGENPLEFTSNLLDVSGALKKKEGSVYGYEYYDPTEEEWNEQCVKESIVYGQDETGAPIAETEEEFRARALLTVPDTNWMRFRFRVIDGFTWNDGVPFTANDIRFTLDYILKHAGSLGSFAYFLTNYHQSYVTEEGDFVIELATNNYSDMKTICTALVILPEHIWQSVKSPASEKNLSVVGTGPYYIEEGNYIADSTITLTYREDYDETLQAKEFAYEPIRHIVVALMSNEDVLINALQKGDIDLMLDTVTPSKAYAVAENGGYDQVCISSVNNDFVTTLLFNVGEYGIFNDKNLDGCSYQIRKAISLCIDQDTLIADALHGMGARVGDGLVQDYYNHALKDPDGGYVYHETNVEKANALLDTTPYRMDANGSRGLTFTVYAMPNNEVIVKALATQLKQIGITLEYEQANSTYSETIKQSNHADFDIIINTVTYTADKLLMFDARYGVYADGSPRLWNYSGLIDPELSALMKAMETASDTAGQYRLCAEVQQYLSDIAVEIPLFAEDKITFYTSQRFTGWVEVQGTSVWNEYSIRYLHPVKAE